MHMGLQKERHLFTLPKKGEKVDPAGPKGDNAAFGDSGGNKGEGCFAE